MQISMKCSIAIHCLIFINEAQGKVKITSKLLSQSTGCNPVIIRNILSKLKKAGIISVKQGTGGATLCKEPSEINIFMIYHALEPQGLNSLIGIHSCEEGKCPIAKNIRGVLEEPYMQVQKAVEDSMKSITLDTLIDKYHELSEKGHDY